jgi:hypothetical protein
MPLRTRQSNLQFHTPVTPLLHPCNTPVTLLCNTSFAQDNPISNFTPRFQNSLSQHDCLHDDGYTPPSLSLHRGNSVGIRGGRLLTLLALLTLLTLITGVTVSVSEEVLLTLLIVLTLLTLLTGVINSVSRAGPTKPTNPNHRGNNVGIRGGHALADAVQKNPYVPLS